MQRAGGKIRRPMFIGLSVPVNSSTTLDPSSSETGLTPLSHHQIPTSVPELLFFKKREIGLGCRLGW